MNTDSTDSPFGEVIYAYTRKQAVADGVQVDVSKTAKEAGISFPVFLTRTVFDAYVAVSQRRGRSKPPSPTVPVVKLNGGRAQAP